MTTPRSPAGCRCPTCTNAAGPWASASRCPRSPGRAWAATEDERYRIAATADGGIFVLHTPYPEPLTQLAGTRRVLETAHKLVGNSWGDEGTTREQRAWTADPDLIRRLDVGQACYIHRGAATFVQVARPKPSPLTLLPPPADRAAAGPGARAPPGARPGSVAVPGHPGPGGFLPPWSRPMNPYPLPNPFAVLGLPEWPDLDDETVDAAWQAIAAETHPDRPDGGNLARYTQATAAYFELHSPWGRSEAFADLLEAAWAEGRYDAYPGHYPPGYDPDDPADYRRPARGRPSSARSRWPRSCTSWPRSRPGSAAATRRACCSPPRSSPGCAWPCSPCSPACRDAAVVAVADRVVRAVRPGGHGTPRPAGPQAAAAREDLMPPAGPRAPGWPPGPAPGCRPVAGWGPGACPSLSRRPR